MEKWVSNSPAVLAGNYNKLKKFPTTYEINKLRVGLMVDVFASVELVGGVFKKKRIEELKQRVIETEFYIGQRPYRFSQIT